MSETQQPEGNAIIRTEYRLSDLLFGGSDKCGKLSNIPPNVTTSTAACEWRSEGRAVILLQGYFDDSGSHGGEGIYALGGFLAPSVSWPRFSAEWQGVLIKDPAIDYFKMSEAISLRGQFERWPGPLRDQKVFELAEVAERWAVARLSAMVLKEDFDTHIKGASPWRGCR